MITLLSCRNISDGDLSFLRYNAQEELLRSHLASLRGPSVFSLNSGAKR